MTENQPVSPPPETPHENAPLYDTKALQEFLGGGWEHDSDDWADYFIFRHYLTKNALKLIFRRGTQEDLESEGQMPQLPMFRAHVKRVGGLIFGETGIFMTGVSSIDYLSDVEAGYMEAKALRVRTQSSEFLFYPGTLLGFFKAGDTDQSYFNFAAELSMRSVG